MGRGRARERGEGWLIAAALGLVLLAFPLIELNRRPRAELVAPVHCASVQAEALERLEKVDINAATAAELDELPGIGEELAARIVEWREAHGPFADLDALTQVPGIGEGKLAALRERAYAG